MVHAILYGVILIMSIRLVWRCCVKCVAQIGTSKRRVPWLLCTVTFPIQHSLPRNSHQNQSIIRWCDGVLTSSAIIIHTYTYIHTYVRTNINNSISVNVALKCIVLLLLIESKHIRFYIKTALGWLHQIRYTQPNKQTNGTYFVLFYNNKWNSLWIRGAKKIRRKYSQSTVFQPFDDGFTDSNRMKWHALCVMSFSSIA